MALRMTQLLVVDLEATCWKTDADRKGRPHEVIEVGLVSVDLHGDHWYLGMPQSMIVRPTFTEVSRFCTDLTGITPEQANEGLPFPEACARLRRDYGTRPWVSWGDWDRDQLARQCRAEGIDPPLGRTHLNLKALHALMGGHSRQVGLGAALLSLDLRFKGTPHRGVDDAYNTALLMRRLFGKEPS